MLGRFWKSWEDLGSREDLGRLRKIWEDMGRLGKIWKDLGIFKIIFTDYQKLQRLPKISIPNYQKPN